MECSAERMASSMAGKISSPFSSGSIRLPSVQEEPSRFPRVRRNVGLSAELTCAIGLLTEGPPLDRFRYSSVATRVMKNVPAIAAIKILFPLRVKAGLFLLALSNDPYGPRWLLLESSCVYSRNRTRLTVGWVTEFAIDMVVADE